MADTGFIVAGLGADGGGGGIVWANPTNIQIDDTNNAVASLFSTDVSNFLKASTFDFTGASIGDTDEIVGMELRVDRHKAGSGECNDDTIQIFVAGSEAGSNLADATNWAAAAQIIYGGPTITWGLTLTGVDVKLSTFGAGLKAKHVSGGGASARVDHMALKIYFEVASGDVPFVPGPLMLGGI